MKVTESEKDSEDVVVWLVERNPAPGFDSWQLPIFNFYFYIQCLDMFPHLPPLPSSSPSLPPSLPSSLPPPLPPSLPLPSLPLPSRRVSISSKKISPQDHRQTVFVEKCFVSLDISTCCSRNTLKVCEKEDVGTS